MPLGSAEQPCGAAQSFKDTDDGLYTAYGVYGTVGCGARHCPRRPSLDTIVDAKMYAVLIYLRKMTSAGGSGQRERKKVPHPSGL